VLLVILGLAAAGFASDDDGSATGVEAPSAADDDFSFAPDAGSSDSGGPSCDDAIVVPAGGGSVQVPGDDDLFGDSSIECEVDGGSDAEAVVVLQDALVRCNGQAIRVDGDFGPETSGAVTNVQQQHGVAADGTYDPATLLVMQWPAGGGCVPLP
jgi:peptidoglycan hydrolase-like protein with peptidoglycan-binding domain